MGALHETPADEGPDQRTVPIGAGSGGLFARYPYIFEIAARLVFGGTVIAAAVGQMLPGGPEYLATRIPTHPGPWFSFWAQLARANPNAFASALGGLELIVGVSVLLGLLRKILYSLGMVLSLFVWSTVEGVTGITSRHSLGSSAGLLYLVGLLLLITVETTYGPDPLTVDAYVTRAFPTWGRWSNFIGRREPLPPPSYMLAFVPRAVRSTGPDAQTPRPDPAVRHRPRR